MYRKKRRMFFEFPFIIIAVALLAGLVVMFLWNAILPQAVHASTINYWQALGLLVLCRILFGSFRGRHRDRRPDMFRGGGSPWRQKWMNMNDEERAKFREEWKKRCRRPGEE